MAADDENDEVFDEGELADGFDEEIVDEEGSEEGEDSDDGDEEPGEVLVAEAPAAGEDDDDIEDADVELALDEVLAETIMRTSVSEDDDDAPIEIDPNADPQDQILPKQDDEFRCASCRLLKKQSQLADAAKQLCRDCV
jgi:hypothetical protein